MAAQSKTAPAPALAQLADEYGAIRKEYDVAIAPLKAKLKRLEAIETALQELCPTKPAVPWTVEGRRFLVNLGPRANQRKIDFAKLVSRISAAAFAKFATCTLKALDEHVRPEIVEQVISETRTGHRTFTFQEKGAL